MPDDNRALEPPDPIPNSEVKRCIADGSVGPPHVRVGHCQVFITNSGPFSVRGFSYMNTRKWSCHRSQWEGARGTQKKSYFVTGVANGSYFQSLKKVGFPWFAGSCISISVNSSYWSVDIVTMYMAPLKPPSVSLPRFGWHHQSC